MRTAKRKVTELHQDPANARLHGEKNLAAIKASLARFGQQKPVVIDANGIVRAGNGTLAAARALGWATVDVVESELSEAELIAYGIADNRTAELAEWDEEVLERVLSFVAEEEPGLEGTGFDAEDLDAFRQGDMFNEEPAEAGDPPEEPASRPGDLWHLGAHRLLCGDSTSPDDVGRLLGKDVPQLMVTDPPYGVDYDPAWRREAGFSTVRRDGKVQNDGQADWTGAWQLFPGDVAYVWHAGVHAAEVASSMAAAELQIRSQIIWAKNYFPVSRDHYHWKHEPCWYAVRKGGKGHWAGDRKQTTVWEIDIVGKDEDDTPHGTQKPIECMQRPMRNHEAEQIYDPFLGSGTTLMAANQLGRACFGLEISPAYCDVIVDRWQRTTSEEAKLAGDGRTFKEVAIERVGGAKA